ncbi:MAG: IMP dehydrogenase [Acholeplasmataceae bacterium]
MKIREALTFDDVLLEPRYSDVLPRDVDLRTNLTKRIRLNIPLLSSAMDTVTESAMAIAVARQGGIGIIHKNMTIDQQVAHIRRVKLADHGLIGDPVTVRDNQSLTDALGLMDRYRLARLPVVDSDNRLLGVLSDRDIRANPDRDTAVESIAMKNDLISLAVGTSREKAKAIMIENRLDSIPLVDEKNTLKGLYALTAIGKASAFPNAAKDDQGRLLVGAAIGVTEDTLSRVRALVEAEVDVIAIDSAHGHSKGIIDTVRSIKDSFPKLDVIAGNIATADAAKALIRAGADALKVGVGPGSICTTRIIAGVGVPQITAIDRVCSYAKRKGIPVIADGGIRYSGDIGKAIAAGANAVMVGGLLAGCEEAPGDDILIDHKRYKVYQGMGSLAAMQRGSKDRYFQTEAKKLVPEGIEGRVPYRGDARDAIYQLMGGLRSAMGYCGTRTIKDLIETGRFVRITAAGYQESHPHGVEPTAEAPNYHKEK